MEEYIGEFEQLPLKCDLKEDETQTLVRYLSCLDDQIAHVVELHPYSSLDDLSLLAYKKEQQWKAKGKGTLSKPPTRSYPFQRPQTQTLDHKLLYHHGQMPLLPRMSLKGTP